MTDPIYFQCRFEQITPLGKRETVGWVEKKGAKVGAQVELKGEEGLWTVISAGGVSQPLSRLREKQAADRAHREFSDI